MAVVRVGVLALQGSFREHILSLRKLPNVEAIEVRTKEELLSCHGLIIPGGESTTMALVAERWGLIPELQRFHQEGRPIWGTCAGLIFLAARAQGQKEGGQQLLGGLDVEVSRNFFGAQINSFECDLPVPSSMPRPEEGPCRALFIRAPAILEAGPQVEVLSEYQLSREEQAQSGRDKVIVAVRQGVLMATAFHPELTTDTRWHAMFVEMVRGHAAKVKAAEYQPKELLGRPYNRPLDMPVYGKSNIKEMVHPEKF